MSFSKRAKHHITLTIVLFSLLYLCEFICGEGHSSTFPARGISVVLDDNYPPYSFRSLEGTLQGYLIDLWAEWEALIGIPVNLYGMEWGLALERMKGGEFDVIDTIFKTEEREKYLEFSEPYRTIEVPIFFHRDIAGIASVNDLRGFVVGVKHGDAVINFLQDRGIFRLQEFPSYESIVLAAKLDTIRVFSVDKPPALYFLSKFNLLDRFRSSKPLYTGEFHRAVRKGNESLLALVEYGFQRISRTTYRRIELKWYGAHLVPRIDKSLLVKIGSGLLSILLLLFLWILTLKKAVRARSMELLKEKTYVSSILDSVAEGILLFTPDGSLLSCNRSIERMIAFPLTKFLPLPLKMFCSETPPFTEEAAQKAIQRTVNGGPQQINWLAKHRKGHSIPVEVFLRAVTRGGEVRVIASVRDITERVRFIDTLKGSLKEKEALMQELLHRTKNNLQLANSLLSIYLGRFTVDPAIAAAVTDLQNRIATIATVHEMLCASSEYITSIDLKSYLERISNLINKAFHLEDQGIVLTFVGEPLEVPSKTAVLIGLLINELVTNSVKHAFEPGKGGAIRIVLQQPSNQDGVLEVSDSGKGLQEGFEPRKASSIGLLTLHSLVEQQLNGTISFRNANAHGLTVTIRFPIPILPNSTA